MKNLKFLFIFILAISISSCGDDDSVQLQDDTPAVSFDVDAIIALPAFTDITSLVTFNGVVSDNYTTELEVNERLFLGRPDGLLPTDIFIYDFLVVFDEEINENGFDNNLLSADSNLQLVVPNGEPTDYYNPSGSVDYGVPQIIILAVDNDPTDIEYKYDLEVTIERGGVVFGPYTIDPKIRIKS
ncbi:hypothetical protein BTO05_02380 [Winogradskyella sp. PC-19]|uniref:hypothetical protein n=1 Tax=unclassified Winogradskyella TaxID=2615021 RepID=UPI000B3CB7CA|nr:MULTISPECIES: hypothetical protein [unclassified Winogradskyella]ARV08542.1 hypothetical protein BTO05_02380 [Winogradskyella sp. PC-19]